MMTRTSARALDIARKDSSPPSSPWSGSPFEWMKDGRVAEYKAGADFFVRLCELHFGSVPVRTTTPKHFVVRDQVVCLAFQATVDELAMKVQFHDEVDKYALLAVNPSDAFLWVISAEDMYRETGHDRSVTFTFNLASPPDWIVKYGGSIEQGLASLIRSR